MSYSEKYIIISEKLSVQRGCLKVALLDLKQRNTAYSNRYSLLM